MITKEQLEAIRKRAEKATEGPWRIGRQSPNGLNNVGTMGGLLTAQTTDESNAEFIAHAREDVPALLEEVDRLNNRLNDAENLLSEAHDMLDDVHCYNTDVYYAISKYFYGEDSE